MHIMVTMEGPEGMSSLNERESPRRVEINPKPIEHKNILVIFPVTSREKEAGMTR